jgi:hypothetical protein
MQGAGGNFRALFAGRDILRDRDPFFYAFLALTLLTSAHGVYMFRQLLR